MDERMKRMDERMKRMDERMKRMKVAVKHITLYLPDSGLSYEDGLEVLNISKSVLEGIGDQLTGPEAVNAYINERIKSSIPN